MKKLSGRGEDKYEKMTGSPLAKLIYSLAGPAVVANIITVIYNLVDTFYVGHLSAAAAAASGVVMPLMVAVKSVGMMLGMGGANKMSIALGKKNKHLAESLVATSFYITLVVSIILAAVCIALRGWVCRILGAASQVAPLASLYMIPLLIAAPLNCLTYIFNPVLRFQGMAKESMIGISAGAILNIFMEPLFIFSFHLGMLGAGIATAICQVISFLLLAFIYRARGQVRIKLKFFRFAQLRPIFSTGMPTFFRNIMRALGMDILDVVAAPFGVAAVAAMTIVNRIITLSNSLRGGLGQGYQPVCGYNYGAGKFDRVRRGYEITVWSVALVIGVIAVLQLIFAPDFIFVFQTNPAVVKIGAEALRWQSATLVLTSWIVMFNMVSQTLNHPVLSTIVGSLRRGVVLIPLLLILPHFLSLLGVEIAQPIADLTAFAFALPCQAYVFSALKKEGAALAVSKGEGN
ncbi:MAG: MATE family efflux transporter [Aeriscardovia sp.]|nr:MATE family efflux transporter [Aeriscardovia sp.]MBQ5493174.1 MATE family efflux transporter [Aeriscardovia sp.]